jgi:hypothetical protein
MCWVAEFSQIIFEQQYEHVSQIDVIWVLVSQWTPYFKADNSFWGEKLIILLVPEPGNLNLSNQEIIEKSETYYLKVSEFSINSGGAGF